MRANGGDLTKQTIGRLAKQIGNLIAQGKPDSHIRPGLANWYLAGQNPATLDNFVNSAMNAAARARASQNGHGDSTANDRARQGIEAGRRVQAYIDQNGGTA